MPGIDKQRVVGKDEEELDEFTCDICLQIFEEPVVTQCCRKTFCTVCIKEWLADNNTCPNDRKSLNVNQLIPASRMVTNLLNKLKIKCGNHEKGCQFVLNIEEMANHMKVCNTCDSCKTSQKLLSDNKKTIETLESENEKLKTDLDQSKKELRQLKASNPISEESEAEAINNTRNDWNPIEENIFGLSIEEVNYLTNLAKSALLKSRSFGEVSEFIIKDIECQDNNEYIWSIKTDYKQRRISCHSPYNKLLRLTFNSLTIGIIGFKTN